MTRYSVDVSFDITLDFETEADAIAWGEEKARQVSGDYHDPFGHDWGTFVTATKEEEL